VAADSTEEEQVEELKNWFAANGLSLLMGIVLALGGVFGYRAWENSVRQTGETASALYEDLIAAVGTVPESGLSMEMATTGGSLAEQLKKEHDGSSYALFAAMTMAKLAVDEGDLDKAVVEFKWVLANGAEGSIEILSRIRLARVLSAQELYEEALVVLEPKLALAAYRSSWEEVKGDVYLSMGRMDEAREAYQLAVSSLGEEGTRPYLDMKLADLTFPLADNPGEAALQSIEKEAEVVEAVFEEPVEEPIDDSIEDHAEEAILSPEEGQ
jgi:predicted negative regulator of RcsB-dependent stress response